MSVAPACSGTGSRITSQSGARRATSPAKRSSRRLSNSAGARAGKIGSPLSIVTCASRPRRRAAAAQLEARAPGEVGQQLRERAPVDERVAEQRERPGDVQPRGARPARAAGDVAEQAAELREPHDRPQPALDAQREVRGAHDDRLGEREVGVQRDLGRRRDRIGRAHRPLARQIGEQHRVDRLRRDAEPRGHAPQRRSARGASFAAAAPNSAARTAAGRSASASPRDRAAAARRSRGSRSGTAPGSPPAA